MNKRLQRLGIGLALMGLVFFAAGGYTLYKTQQGAGALQAFSAAQNVKLTYNADGQLADAGQDRRGHGDHGSPGQRLGLLGRQVGTQPE